MGDEKKNETSNDDDSEIPTKQKGEEEEEEEELEDEEDFERNETRKTNADHKSSEISDGSKTLPYEPGIGFKRYENSLKNLLPIRANGKDRESQMSIDNAGLYSIITFAWISKIMYKAFKNGTITFNDLPKMSPYDGGTYNAKRLELLWKNELKLKGPANASFVKVVWKFCRTRIIASCLVSICSLFSGIYSYTYVMRNLLEHVESANDSYIDGIKWSVLLITAELFRTLFLAWAWALNYRSALRVRGACLTLLYKKIIRVDNLASKDIGKVINMFSNDAHRIFDVLVIGPMIIGAPICTIFAIFYIVTLFGPVGLLGMIAFVLFFPIQYLMSLLAGYLQDKAIRVSDSRVRSMNEILDCVKLIKMYAWEKRFGEDIVRLRNKERKVISQNAYCQTSSECLAPIAPVISATVTFSSYVAFGGSLTAAKAFPYITLLDSGLRLWLYFFQDGVYYIVAAAVSFKRLKNILIMDDGGCSISKPILKSQALTIVDGRFAYSVSGDWDKRSSSEIDEEKPAIPPAVKGGEIGSREAGEVEQGKPIEQKIDMDHVDVLFEISFEAAKGKLVGICGPVGSGKSSLLLAALGQLRISEGQVARDGECAYVSQQAWITNATLRENILFGAKFDKKWYNEVVWACSLSQDIAAMPGGDETEIGERGINLSGGQKQRVALARALYADRDIYLLDDPLSAVDSRVGSHIFDNLIVGALKEKTVLFVTHQIQYLNRCDDVYMMRDGRIVEHGTHDQLMKLDNEYASMVAAISIDNETAEEPIREQKIETLAPPVEKTARRIRTKSINSCAGDKSLEKSKTPDAQLIVTEDVEEGAIKAHTYHSYVQSAGGYFTAFVVLMSFVVVSFSTAFSSWWLAHWIKAGGGNATIAGSNETVISTNMEDNPDFAFYQIIYIGTVGVIILACALRTLIFVKATLGASTTMHNKLFKKVIACPMRFFDTNPVGRIQHLFSRDMDEVDNRLPYTIASILDCVTIILFSVLIICIVLPWFILPLVVLGAVYCFISRIFSIAIRDLKRMDNMARAPIISFVTATVEGLGTIHAFGKEDDFLKKFTHLFDENSKCLFLYNGAMRWLAVRIDMLSVGITAVTAFLVITLQQQVPAPLAGLALAFATQMSDLLQYTIRVLSETEVRFISVERITHYIRTLKGEGDTEQCVVKPSSTWPDKAAIKFSNVGLAYGDGTPYILKNLSFAINGGEKIGIVGRTGAGKSSLTVALFRLVELAEGKIEIDGVDISEISLQQLRTKLSIIPQDPVLFSGTVRSNLDPFDLYSDSQIWDALEKTELKNRVRSISGQLDASVGFGGDNMSVGERQLLCLSRALLRNSKILVLDEATAAVDPETEKVVQETVQKEFSDCTILVIAHRLQTVLSLDRVLVMEAGEILEFDTPSNLLSNENSEFSKMMAAVEESAGQ